jgi:hypothetical protein
MEFVFLQLNYFEFVDSIKNKHKNTTKISKNKFVSIPYSRICNQNNKEVMYSMIRSEQQTIQMRKQNLYTNIFYEFPRIG